MIVFGALAGLAAGLVGAAMMEGFQTAWSKAREALAGKSGGGSGGGDAEPGEPQKLAAVAEEGGAAPADPATVKVAAAATTSVAGTRLGKAEKKPAGRLVHYAFGAGNGVLYGALADVLPVVTSGFGSLFGVAVWIYADNLLLWATGLATRPTDYPVSTHAYALASHLVYGIAVEAVRQVARPPLPS
jgi:putative membrane protein